MAPPTEPQLLEYSGTNNEILLRVPSREGLVREHCPELTARLQADLEAGDELLVMPTAVDEREVGTQGRKVYEMHLYGALQNGAKVQLILEEVPVFFEVLVPEGAQADAHAYMLRESLPGVTRVETLRGRKVRGFQTGDSDFCRLHFATRWDRKQAIERAAQQGHQTFADDLSAYYRLVARTHGLTLTDWLRLPPDSYVYRRGGRHPAGEQAPSPHCEHVIRVPVGQVESYVDPIEPAPARAQARLEDPLLTHDRTVVVAWDIETYTPRRGEGQLPEPQYPEDVVHMICLTAHWRHDARPLAQVCLTTVPSEPDPAWLTVVCPDQAALLRAFGLAFQQLAPDIVTGFNDGAYDWPFVIEKSRQMDLLGELFERLSARPPAGRPPTTASVVNYFRRTQRIKISPESDAQVETLSIPGCVCVDTRVVFRQLYPKDQKSSLNHFLRRVKLESKADMAYTRMRRIYEARDPAGTREVANYCVIDAKRCQELLLRRNVVADRREVGTLSFTSLHDCFFYAGGHKVCNMMAAYAARRNIHCSMRGQAKREEGKYPGAYVLEPVKGLETQRPVTGLDFSSLYPSIIMCYNLSPDTYLGTAEEAEAARAQGYNVYCRPFEFNGRTIRGWFVRHDNLSERRGLYPCILEDLFNKRLELKQSLAVHAERLERWGKVLECRGAGRSFVEAHRAACDLCRAEQASPQNNDYQRALYSTLLRELAERYTPDAAGEAAFEADYRDAEFRHASVDSKQKAVKVFMNTFYGEAGNALSAFFLLALAGTVTGSGQDNLRLVDRYVRSQDYEVKYGDTDSLYIMCPFHDFQPALEQYLAATAHCTSDEQRLPAFIELCKEKVRVTMRRLDQLRQQVNATLRADNGTDKLKMAYEEVLFPVALLGKKKYYGIEHKGVPNFTADGQVQVGDKRIFIRGIDIIKQGQTELAVQIGQRVMARSLCQRLPGQEETMLQIVEETLADAVLHPEQWNFEDFIQAAAWKPNKQNVPVQTFMARMRVRHEAALAENRRREARGEPPLPLLYGEPEEGERFSFVVVKHEVAAEFDIRGCRVPIRKGDKMEYAEVVRQEGGLARVDVQFYLNNYIVGLCARFINYEPRFADAGTGLEGREQDEKLQDAAAKYLRDFLARIQGGGGPDRAALGRAYKQAYKQARSLDAGSRLFGAPTAGREPDAVAGFLRACREAAEALPLTTDVWLAALGVDPGTGRDLQRPARSPTFTGLFQLCQFYGLTPRAGRGHALFHKAMVVALSQAETEARGELGRLAPQLQQLADRERARFEARVQALRLAPGEALASGEAPGEAPNDDQQLLREAREVQRRLVATIQALRERRALQEKLKRLRDGVRQDSWRPSPSDVQRSIDRLQRSVEE